ncbi:MAG TPA: helix-turn-helix domain-containing protein [Pseudonocardia sp.]
MTATDLPKLIFSPREVAAMTVWPYESVLQLIYSGRLPAQKIQGRWAISRRALEKLQAELEAPT